MGQSPLAASTWAVPGTRLEPSFPFPEDFDLVKLTSRQVHGVQTSVSILEQRLMSPSEAIVEAVTKGD